MKRNLQVSLESLPRPLYIFMYGIKDVKFVGFSSINYDFDIVRMSSVPAYIAYK
jgi:hypothetical protein